MNKTEKQFKKYMENNIPVKNTFQNVVSKIDLEEGENKMKNKKLIPILGGCLSLLLVGGICAIALGNRPEVEPKAKAVVSIDVNPSIELVVDDTNKVISVTGTNEDGKMILVDEEIVNKSLDEAIEIIISTEKETGFLISGRVSDGENEIKVSVSGETQDIINEVNNSVKNSISLVCDDLNIKETITEVEKYGREVLEARVVEIDPTLESKVKEMTHEELLNVIKIHHLETSDVYSQKLEELYLEVRNNEISFSEKDSIQSVINSMDEAYQSFLDVYRDLLASLQSFSNDLEELRYTLLIDPESSYQEAVTEVNNAKLELNALKVKAAEEENPSILLQTEIQIKETILSTVTTILEGVEETTNSAIDLARNSLNQVIVSLEEQEASFPSEIKTELTNKVSEIETRMNETKDKAFENFETKYGEDISRIKEEVQARKQALIDSLK